MKKGYIMGFLAHPTTGEINLIIFSVVAAIFPQIFMGDWYLWSLALLADIVGFIAHGAWQYEYEQRHAPHTDDRQGPPWLTPVNANFRIVALGGICVLCAIQEYFGILATGAGTTIRTYVWYAAVIIAICDAFRGVLKSMNYHDDSWLAGTNGHIGTPNWISIIRIGFALITPHIYVAQSFGNWSNFIASAILATAIATDLLDGLIARKTKQITKAGKALDPLGDKFILYPNAAAFIIATSGQLALPAMLHYEVSIVVAICLTVARDLLFVLWFLLKGRKLKEGIGASLVDKARMLTICIWIGSTAVAITIPGAIGAFMAWFAFVSLLTTGVLSVISLVVDLIRVNRLTR